MGLPARGFPLPAIDSPGDLCHAVLMNAEESPLLDVTLGRKGVLGGPTSLKVSHGRELTLEDLGLLASTKVGGKQVLKKLRASHHQAARLLAQGCKPGEVSALSGFSPSRISVLQDDPAFAELVEHYTQVEQSRFADVQERMTLLGLAAGEEIMDRLDEDPALISTKELVEVVKASLDRGGHAPVTKSENKHVHALLSTEDLAAMKSAQGETTILDKASIHGKNTEKEIQGEVLSKGEGTPVGEASARRPFRIKLSESSRGESEGSGV